MKHTKSLLVVAVLLVLSCASLVAAQTRTRRSASPRMRRGGVARTTVKPPAPCPVSMSTTTASGLTYLITRHGTGEALKAGETVIVNYTGLLTNGMKFDSSLDRGEPFAFPLGAGRVIQGWDEGVAQLHVGDQATLIIPSQLGYGERGAGGAIPPNATLIFIIEVLGIKQETPTIITPTTPAP